MNSKTKCFKKNIFPLLRKGSPAYYEKIITLIPRGEENSKDVKTIVKTHREVLNPRLSEEQLKKKLAMEIGNIKQIKRKKTLHNSYLYWV